MDRGPRYLVPTWFSRLSRIFARTVALASPLAFQFGHDSKVVMNITNDSRAAPLAINVNPFRKSGLPTELTHHAPQPSVNVTAPLGLLAQCPIHNETPLHETKHGDGAKLLIKDERDRMGLGSFKALGAAYVIAHLASQTGKAHETALQGKVFVTASAGNHGLSVAAAAPIFGARAVVYLAETVPTSFAAKLREKGATVIIEGDDYEESMSAATNAAKEEGWVLLSDSSWPEYFELPHRLMEGYLVLAHETVQQCATTPTHIFLQAGVGGLAGSCAAYFRKIWGDAPRIIVVEPSEAPALQASILAGRPVKTTGGVSSMGRLDCKEPSLIALRALSHDADYFLTIDDDIVEEQLAHIASSGCKTTPSGGAGLAAFMALGADHRQFLGIDAGSTILTILSEGA